MTDALGKTRLLVLPGEPFGETAAAVAPPRSRWLLIVLAGIAVTLVGLAVGTILVLRGERIVIVLTQDQIQEKLDARFPMEKPYAGLLTLTLSDPRVKLVEGGDRVTLGLKADTRIRINDQPRTLSGKAVVTTGLRYEPGDYSFYLDDPVVDKVEIEGLPVKHVKVVNFVAKAAAQDRINRTHVYTLDPRNAKQAAARLVLRGMIVKDGRLIVTVGL